MFAKKIVGEVTWKDRPGRSVRLAVIERTRNKSKETRMGAMQEQVSLGSLLWRGRWIVLGCAAASVAIALLLIALSPTSYQTAIRVAMVGNYASPEVRKATYEEFVRWRARQASLPSAPVGVSIGESYNPVSETATLTLTLPDSARDFAQTYFSSLATALEGFSQAKIAQSERKLATLSDLSRSLGLQGSDYVASLASDLSFFLEDVKDQQAVATMTAPVAPHAVPRGSLPLSVLFALVVGAGTGILFLVSRSLWLARRGSREDEQESR